MTFAWKAHMKAHVVLFGHANPDPQMIMIPVAAATVDEALLEAASQCEKAGMPSAVLLAILGREEHAKVGQFLDQVDAEIARRGV